MVPSVGCGQGLLLTRHTRPQPKGPPMTLPEEPVETLGIDLDDLSEEEYAELVRDWKRARDQHPSYQDKDESK